MAMTPTQSKEAYQFFIVAFGAAPGVVHMNDLYEAYGAGMTTQQIVNVYTAKPNFLAMYPNFLSNESFADKLIENVLGSSASAVAKQESKDQIASALTSGMTRGDVIYTIFNNLFTKEEGDSLFQARQMLENKVVVAQYLTETLLINTTDLAQLRALVANVTAAPASVDAAKAVAAGATGQTFTLTAGVDVLEGTAGNDTFIAATVQNNVATFVQSLTNLDVIDGKGGVNTLKVADDSTSALILPTSVTVKNIQNVEIVNAAQSVTADVQNWEGLKNIAVDQRDAALTSVTTKSNATSLTVKGGTTVGVTDNGTGTGATKDTLATVSVEKATGATTINSDALTKLTLTEANGGATINAAVGSRSLDLTVNKLNGGTITDGEATGLKVTASGDNTTGITLTAGKATSIEFAGDKTVSTTLGAQAANLNITSSNTAGVTITSASTLNNDVTFTGGAGKDTVTVGATTKTIDMGAGDDTVEVTVALGTNGKLVGGEGTDTLKMSAALADTLDANDTFAKAVEGFEKLSLGAVAANTANTVNLANLDDISYVISAGTAAGGSAEKAVVTFAALTLGQSITVNGVTVKAVAAAGAAAADIAAAFAAGTTHASLEITGTVGADWTRAAVTGDSTKVEFTSTGSGDVTDLLPTTAGVAAATAPTINKLNDGDGSSTPERVQIFVNDLVAGQSVTVNGLTLTAHKALTGAEVATALGVVAPATSAGSYAISGSKTIATLDGGSAVANSFLLTGTDSVNVGDVIVSAAGVATPAQTTVAAVATSAGVAGASLTLTNMANAGTFEQTGVVAGAATVTMKDATGAADSLNIKLNGAASLVNTGTLTVAGVETINIEATDSSADTTTLTNPAAASKPNLVAADATKIVVTGNHGVDFTGSTLTKVVELDASGVVATGATTGATAAQIGTAGAVTFSSAVTDKSVTVKTGNGADVINLSSVTDATKGATVTTGEGGDTITGTAGNDTIDAGAGRDTVNATAGADTITLGAGNDLYVLGLATNSTLAKSDIITDFVANTKGQGTTAADIAKGATGTVADLTGDTIDVTAALQLAGAASTGITVFVASNAADAQTFLQNTGNAGTLTGFALDSTTGKLYMDFDSNGTVDSVLTLTGVTTITEAAFVTGY